MFETSSRGVGFGAIVSGAMRAPLTGALFAAELTGQYQTLPYTMACAIGAYAVSVLMMRRSILTEKIARRGRHVLQEFSVDQHDLIQAGQIMSTNPVTLSETMKVSEAITLFRSGARFRSYPVIDAAGRLSGMVSRNDALSWQDREGLLDITLADALSDSSQPHVNPDTPIGAVADIILQTGQGRVPVVSANDQKVVGMVTRHDLLKARFSIRQEEKIRSRPITFANAFRKTR